MITKEKSLKKKRKSSTQWQVQLTEIYKRDKEEEVPKIYQILNPEIRKIKKREVEIDSTICESFTRAKCSGEHN